MVSLRTIGVVKVSVHQARRPDKPVAPIATFNSVDRSGRSPTRSAPSESGLRKPIAVVRSSKQRGQVVAPRHGSRHQRGPNRTRSPLEPHRIGIETPVEWAQSLRYLELQACDLLVAGEAAIGSRSRIRRLQIPKRPVDSPCLYWLSSSARYDPYVPATRQWGKYSSWYFPDPAFRCRSSRPPCYPSRSRTPVHAPPQASSTTRHPPSCSPGVSAARAW